ncbi:uncharacterized protein TRAVEDRAFT_41340 [Trametes versicolor FP-101664 SS1]|uniref:uncharacterized protein n=1 Tax=Trametes versicolor (strain FP-101664) TaxID=717944 RepID=UPI000462449E|nr:uncharacterized protein TRAVEDRAFT_41340 [Trametes versicolor FP-101664 SS1]EIW63914.1 hypothetical protein TRAVEDRAFT_41340 [Trametes versicolor FP-101664 SS1]
MTTTPQRIALYGSPHSPFVARVRLALEEAQADYHTVFFDLDERPQWFFDNVNSAGKVSISTPQFNLAPPRPELTACSRDQVPTIVYRSSPDAPPEKPTPESAKIAESLVLLEFVADLHPNANLLPRDPVLRAKARLFIRKLDEKFQSAFLALLFDKDGGAEVLELLVELQNELPPTGYVVGDWSIADAAFVPMVAAVGIVAKTGRGYFRDVDGGKLTQELAAPRFERLREYMRINKERPSFDEFVAIKWVKRFAKPADKK